MSLSLMKNLPRKILSALVAVKPWIFPSFINVTVYYYERCSCYVIHCQTDYSYYSLNARNDNVKTM